MMIMLIPFSILVVSFLIAVFGLPFVSVVTAKNIGGRRAVRLRVGVSHLFCGEDRYWERTW